MAFQYIHTSAKRGLEPGHSGFCCVARDRDTPPFLVKELDRLSRYEHSSSPMPPLIYRYLILNTRDRTYHVLSRVQDAGIDYSKRNNHIAHHLIFEPDEIGELPDPATLLLYWKKWQDRWEGPPRVLGKRDRFNIHELDTADKGEATPPDLPDLVFNGRPFQRHLKVEEGAERQVARHYRRVLQTLPAPDRWRYPFTTFLLSSDAPSRFVWTANWLGRSLPFELDEQPRPIPQRFQANQPFAAQLATAKASPSSATPREESARKKSAPGDRPAKEPDESSHDGKEDEDERNAGDPDSFGAAKAFLGNAPVVEIPKEFDRSKRRRPKARWTPRRISRLINVIIVCITAACVAALYVILKDYQGPPSSPPPVQANSEKGAAPPPEPDEATEWRKLADAGRLLQEPRGAERLVGALLVKGQPRPAMSLGVLRTLDAACRLPGSPGEPLASAPDELIRVEQDQVHLHPSLATLPEFLALRSQLRLATAELTEAMAELEKLGGDAGLIRERLNPTSYFHSDVWLAVKECRRLHRDRIDELSPAQRQSIEAFLDLKRSLREERAIQPLLDLHEGFGYGPHQAYLAYDAFGRLMPAGRDSYLEHMQGLFEDYVLPNFTKFEPTPAFHEALKQASNRKFATAMEAAKAIERTFRAGRPLEPPIERQWKIAHQAWREAFIREDLMQETIIAFSIDRLEESRRRLLELQENFTAEELDSFVSLSRAVDRLDALQRQLRAPTVGSHAWMLLRAERRAAAP